jgi:hypothetical protein
MSSRLQYVEWTSRRSAQLLDHVRVDHRRLDVGVSEILLNLPDVDAVESSVECLVMRQRELLAQL